MILCLGRRFTVNFFEKSQRLQQANWKSRRGRETIFSSSNLRKKQGYSNSNNKEVCHWCCVPEINLIIHASYHFIKHCARVLMILDMRAVTCTMSIYLTLFIFLITYPKFNTFIHNIICNFNNVIDILNLLTCNFYFCQLVLCLKHNVANLKH